MKITKDDVPYHLLIMVDIIGTDKFLEICRVYGGTAIYIPVYKKVIIKQRNMQMKKEFNGKNLDELRIKYDMSKEHVKRVINEGEDKNE